MMDKLTVKDVQFGRTFLFDGQYVTKRQYEFLIAIERLWRKNLLPPTWRELMKEMGVGSTNAISCYVKPLHERGLLRYAPPGEGWVWDENKREHRPRIVSGGRSLITSRMKVRMGNIDGEPGMFIFWG